MDVSGERYVVGEDVVVANFAVVRDVHAHHEKVARADSGGLSLTVGAVKSAVLTNDIVVADLEVARLAFELHILRLAADYGVFKDPIPRSDAGVCFDDCIGRNLAVRADFDVVFNDRCGVNRHVLTGFTRFSGFSG